MKVFITGVSGQLGHDVAKELARRTIAYKGVSSRELDITDADAVAEVLDAYRPDAVIHCAAYTAVDAAEDDAERCRLVNESGTRAVAEGCRRLGAKLVYLSTDYVFPGEGDAFYETDDVPAPLNVYGRTKLAGEEAVRQTTPRHFIVRTSWVIGQHGKNFVSSMLRLAEAHSELSVVADQIGSPTFTADLAPLLCDMIASEHFGTYHATNEGVCSWAELAAETFRLAGNRVTVRPVSTAQYGARAPRPHNSRLSKTSLDQNGFARLPDWHDSLARFLSDRNE